MKASQSRYSKCMYFASNALARKMDKLASESWKKAGLSPSHGYLLMLVLDKPGIQPGSLVEELLLTPSTITRLMDKLSTKKLLHRVAEGKIINVYPTQKAKALEPLLKECVADFNQNCLTAFGKEENSRLVLALNRITDKLDL